MPCPVCGSAYFAAEAQSPTTTNVCEVCSSEWTDYWDTDGNRTEQRIIKNARENAEAGEQPAGEPTIA